jgi:hypothetical protein
MMVGRIIECPAFPAVLRVYHDEALGLLSVEHTGDITWDALQAVKDLIWGDEAAAIEIYPPKDRVVNNIAMRHLWRLGRDDWWPDLAREGMAQLDTMRERYTAVMAGGADGRL